MTEQQQEQPRKRKRLFTLFTEATLVAAVTVASYVAAYQYESGFAWYWDIPRYFIDISLVSVIASAVAIVSVIFIIPLYTNLFISFLGPELSKPDSIRRRLVILHVAFGVGLLLLLRLIGFEPSLIIAALSLIAFIDILYLVIPWGVDRYRHSEPTKFFDRIERSYRCDAEGPDTYSFIRSLTGYDIAGLVLSVAGLIMLCFAVGYSNAKHQKTFYVDQEGLAIIKRYGETYILRPINEESETFGRELVLRVTSDLSDSILHPVRMKQPKLAEKPKSQSPDQK